MTTQVSPFFSKGCRERCNSVYNSTYNTLLSHLENTHGGVYSNLDELKLFSTERNLYTHLSRGTKVSY